VDTIRTIDCKNRTEENSMPSQRYDEVRILLFVLACTNRIYASGPFGERTRVCMFQFFCPFFKKSID